VIEYVPDMTVVHLHGRKSKDAGLLLIKNYVVGTGALYAKFLFRHPNLREKFSHSTAKPPAPKRERPDAARTDISRQAKLLYAAWGAVRYRLHV